MHKNVEEIKNSEEDISFASIIDFINEFWKQLILAGVVGAIFGFGAYTNFGNYNTKIFIDNDFKSDAITENTVGLSLVSWRSLQKGLPQLASQILLETKLSNNQVALYNQLSELDWWTKNIFPNFSVSKSDAKDFSLNSKDVEAAIATISSFTVMTNSQSKNTSIQNAIDSAYFFKSGGAYIQIKTLLNDYSAEVISADIAVKNKNSQIQKELVYLNKRLADLEKLKDKFPYIEKLNQLTYSGSDSVKYLPIGLQIIAVSEDINKNNELILRNDDRLKQIQIIKTFLEEVKKLDNQEFDGMKLFTSLNEVLENLRKSVSLGDLNSLSALNDIQFRLQVINTRFTKGLNINRVPSITKSGVVTWTTLGLMWAEFLIIIFLLGRKLIRKNRLLA